MYNMKKIESEYMEKYGDISKNKTDRLDYLISKIRSMPKFREKEEYIKNIKWKKLNFIIYLVPKPTPRPRYNFIRNTVYVMGAKDNKDIFKKIFIKEDIEMITTPCKFTCISYLPTPKTMNYIEKTLAEIGLIRPISKPDWDNLGKTYSDMIQGTLLYDDNLIIEGISKKYYSLKPRIEIQLEWMDEMDSDFNKKKLKSKKKES